ncbi:helix-turn-helix domain-containing protein [Pseudomonas turukhanskensis]|uniref:HTH luxR-type domain-containing protein n=1 Tax=Pseudomonas turukhanskensis TaxID=1806536 RepID=A0A9W6K2J5_9PSED|nr:helix-turn-helix transcriptional regulator [Pseudomonas turukhanskensis]GLK88291.1 hypothetical protein GCM10017655_13530 [Pseudomonas turukhanskensis]
METISTGNWTGHLGMGLALRELQCLLAVACGKTSKEVAKDLGVAPGTVDKRLLSVTTKLGVTRRTAMVAEAMRRGLIAPAMAMFLAVITCSSMTSTDPVLRVRRNGSHVVAARSLRRDDAQVSA